MKDNIACYIQTAFLLAVIAAIIIALTAFGNNRKAKYNQRMADDLATAITICHGAEVGSTQIPPPENDEALNYYLRHGWQLVDKASIKNLVKKIKHVEHNE